MTQPPPSAALLPDAAATCPCGHSGLQHDVVAARYCEVTTEAALLRGCVCKVDPSVQARSYDRR